MTRVHRDIITWRLSTAPNSLWAPLCSPARPPPTTGLLPHFPQDVMQLESDCVQALQKRCFHLAMLV